MSSGEHSPADYAEPLEKITESQIDYFVEGGQAVNVWADLYSPKAPQVLQLGPFTSKDCDIWVDYPLLSRIEGILKGELVKATDPSQGQLGIFVTDDDPPKTIDLFDQVYGLTLPELKKARGRSLEIKGIRLLDPLFLFKAKCHNLVKLPDQENRNDEKHVRILLEILPAHFAMLLQAAKQHEPEEAGRKLLRELKLFRSFGKDKWVRRALKEMNAELDQLLPIEELRVCGLSKVENFARNTWAKEDQSGIADRTQTPELGGERDEQ